MVNGVVTMGKVSATETGSVVGADVVGAVVWLCDGADDVVEVAGVQLVISTARHKMHTPRYIDLFMVFLL
jgi:hypothetical protein